MLHQQQHHPKVKEKIYQNVECKELSGKLYIENQILPTTELNTHKESVNVLYDPDFFPLSTVNILSNLPVENEQ
jgi:hypothetical protein